jgi:7,8-dihydroneopterin aldolase/epimerase/oxygenase
MGRHTVRLVNAVFHAHHGVMQEEHRIGGRYEVDVSIEYDFEEAAIEDSLEKTVDYERVYQIIKTIMIENRFYLIERVAYLIATRVRESFPDSGGIEVVVRKPNPPVGGTCDRAEAVFRLPAGS